MSTIKIIVRNHVGNPVSATERPLLLTAPWELVITVTRQRLKVLKIFQRCFKSDGFGLSLVVPFNVVEANRAVRLKKKGGTTLRLDVKLVRHVVKVQECVAHLSQFIEFWPTAHLQDERELVNTSWRTERVFVRGYGFRSSTKQADKTAFEFLNESGSTKRRQNISWKEGKRAHATRTVLFPSQFFHLQINRNLQQLFPLTATEIW